MADAKSATIAILRGSSAVTALVGSGTSARIYSKTLPPVSTWPGPAITIQRIGQNPTHAMGSGSVSQSGNATQVAADIRMQVRIWDLRDSKVESTAQAVMDTLDGWSGTSEGFAIGRIFHLMTVDGYEKETRLHHTILDFILQVVT